MVAAHWKEREYFETSLECEHLVSKMVAILIFFDVEIFRLTNGCTALNLFHSLIVVQFDTSFESSLGGITGHCFGVDDSGIICFSLVDVDTNSETWEYFVRSKYKGKLDFCYKMYDVEDAVVLGSKFLFTGVLGRCKKSFNMEKYKSEDLPSSFKELKAIITDGKLVTISIYQLKRLGVLIEVLSTLKVVASAGWEIGSLRTGSKIQQDTVLFEKDSLMS